MAKSDKPTLLKGTLDLLVLQRGEPLHGYICDRRLGRRSWPGPQGGGDRPGERGPAGILNRARARPLAGKHRPGKKAKSVELCRMQFSNFKDQRAASTGSQPDSVYMCGKSGYDGTSRNWLKAKTQDIFAGSESPLGCPRKRGFSALRRARMRKLVSRGAGFAGARRRRQVRPPAEFIWLASSFTEGVVAREALRLFAF